MILVSRTPKLLLLLYLILPYALSQRPDYKAATWQKNRFFFFSDKAPMTKALDKYPDVVFGSKMILDHFRRVENAVTAHAGRHVPENVNVKPCLSTDTVKWPRAVNAEFGILGFPKPDLSCITDFTGVHLTLHDQPPYTLNQLYEAIRNRGLTIRNNARSIAATFIDVISNYTGPDFNFNYPYNTVTLRCVLHPVNAVRVDGRWRLATGMLNRPILEMLRKFARKNIVEYHAVVDGHLTDNLLMRLPELLGGEERIIRDDATTFIFNGRGPTNPSVYRNIPIPENPAILESLESANNFAQQAEDAVSPSNMAILVLPLALNIVPVALFAEVSTIKMLLYVVLTDVLTAIPLLIKGIELIQIQKRLHRAVVTRISSSYNSSANAAAGEMWASECQAKENIREIGKIFVVVSILFIVGGAILELISKSFGQRQKGRLKLARFDTRSGRSQSSERSFEPSQWSALGAKDIIDGSVIYEAAEESYSGVVYLQESGGKPKRQTAKRHS